MVFLGSCFTQLLPFNPISYLESVDYGEPRADATRIVRRRSDPAVG